jgi:RHS repeat-associated protein
VLNVVNEGGKQWYQQDALGSVYGLASNSGILVGSQGYDVFGAPTPAPSGPPGQPFGFTGREHELDSGLVYARDRYVQAAYGRWTQSDRILEAGHRTLSQLITPSMAHPYAYVSNDPTAFTDPLGQIQLPFPDTFKAYLFRLMVHGEYGALIALLKDLGMSAMQRGQAVQALLQQWTAAGAARIVPAAGASGGAAYRVADFLDKEEAVLVELKFMDACNFRLTSQINDFATWAGQNGYRMVLVIRNSEMMKEGVARRLQQLNVTVIELADWAV